MRHGFKAWAERQAILLRQALNLPPHAPLPAARLAAHLGITIVGPERIPGLNAERIHQLLRVDPSGWSAVTISATGVVLIIHNTSHAPCRQESDVMHEQAHIICKHEPARIVPLGNLPWVLRTYDPDQEEEAAWLGGCLQLPREGLLWALQRGMDEDTLSDYCGASIDMVRYRRQKTGVDRQLARRRAWS